MAVERAYELGNRSVKIRKANFQFTQASPYVESIYASLSFVRYAMLVLNSDGICSLLL